MDCYRTYSYEKTDNMYILYTTKGDSTMCVKELSDNMDHVSENYCPKITVLGDLNTAYRKR